MKTWIHLTLLLTLLSACGDDPDPALDAGDDATVDAAEDAEADANDLDGGEPDGGDTDGGEPDGGEPGPLPLLSELDPNAWNELRPGGETSCSRGSEYAFFVRPGTTNKIVVDFIGGGACWNETTCSIAGAIFSDSVAPVRRAVEENMPQGIYDRENEENPVGDWTHVILPYCTGDIHWGNSSTEYSDTLTIEHRGAVNTRAVLDWIYANVDAPEQIFVTGCSAGSYGSLAWSAYLAEHYEGVPTVQFGDSGAGVITESFFRDSFPSWNAEMILPAWIEELDPSMVDIFELDLADLYERVGTYYPDNRFSQYNTSFDDNQAFYYEAMGGEGGAMGWNERMEASTSRIIESTPNYRNFQAPGEQHCIILQPNFYEVESNGVRLVEWLDQLINGEAPENVSCTDCTRATPGTE